MNFRVGQKVVCVDDADTAFVREGAVYTIVRVHSPFVTLDRLDLPAAGSMEGMYGRRFRPVVERKTDISIFTELLTPTGPRVLEPADG